MTLVNSEEETEPHILIAVLKMVAELGAQAKRDSAWTAEQEDEFDAKMNMAFQQPWWKPDQP